MIIKIIASGVIPLQQYGNYQPTIELEEDVKSSDLKVIEARAREMRELAERMHKDRDATFRTIIEMKRQKAQEAKPQDEAPKPKIRWHDIEKPDGTKAKYPSVTSIINPYGIILDDDMLSRGMTDKDMDMYALRGTIVHWVMENFINTGTWLEPSTHEKYKELIEYRSEFIKEPLDPASCNFKGFLEKYGASYKFIGTEIQVINHELEYCGTLDLIGNFLDSNGIFDVKTASSYPQEKKDQYFAQMAGYDLATGGKATQYHIIPLNPSNKCGFGAPIIAKDTKKYQDLFLEKLVEFNKTFRNQAK